jgi:uncharacterized membrane protein YkoI
MDHSWTVQAPIDRVRFMKRTASRTLSTLAAVALLAMSQGAAAACLTPAETRRAVASGEALRLSEAAASVGGDIVGAELCERGSRLVYRISVIRNGGKVVTVVVDARTGQVLR